jgi:hypothetical protein
LNRFASALHWFFRGEMKLGPVKGWVAMAWLAVFFGAAAATLAPFTLLLPLLAGPGAALLGLIGIALGLLSRPRQRLAIILGGVGLATGILFGLVFLP